MASVIKVETLQFFEDRLGKEEGRKAAEVLERAYEEMEKKAESLALQKKLELKDELTKELATKEDIARLEGMIKSESTRLEGMMKFEIARLEGKMESELLKISKETLRIDKKFTIMFILIFFAVIFINQNAIEFILKVFNLVK